MYDRNFIVCKKESGEIVCFTEAQYQAFIESKEPWTTIFSSSAKTEIEAIIDFTLNCLVDMDVLETLIDCYLEYREYTVEPDRFKDLQRLNNLFSDDQKPLRYFNPAEKDGMIHLEAIN